MQLAATFDPSTGTSGTFNSSLPTGGHFVVFNESQFGLTITFDDNESGYVPAWSAEVFVQPVRSPIIQWAQNNTLSSSSAPLSVVNIVAYQPGEKIVGVYPIALSRQQNIGNVVTFSQGSALNVVNDGNPSGTTVVESTVATSPGSNVLIQNQGLVEVLQWVGEILTQIFKIDPGASSVVKLGNTGLLTEVLGPLKIDGTLTTTTGTPKLMYLLATPFHFFTNPTLNSGVTRTDTYTGGSTGVPIGASAVLMQVGVIPNAATGYVQIAPHGGTLGQYANFSSTVAGQYSTGVVIVPLDASGQADVKSVGANIVLQDWWIYGYFV